MVSETPNVPLFMLYMLRFNNYGICKCTFSLHPENTIYPAMIKSFDRKFHLLTFQWAWPFTWIRRQCWQTSSLVKNKMQSQQLLNCIYVDKAHARFFLQQCAKKKKNMGFKYDLTRTKNIILYSVLSFFAWYSVFR